MKYSIVLYKNGVIVFASRGATMLQCMHMIEVAVVAGLQFDDVNLAPDGVNLEGVLNEI